MFGSSALFNSEEVPKFRWTRAVSSSEEEEKRVQYEYSLKAEPWKFPNKLDTEYKRKISRMCLWIEQTKDRGGIN